MNTPSQFRSAAGLVAIGVAIAFTMTTMVSSASAQTENETSVVGSHDGERHRHYAGDGEFLTAEEIEAMIPSREELAAMMLSAEEIQAMVPSEAELRAMIPNEAELRESIPDREELLAMIPIIETVEECHASGEFMHSEESTDPATGRERVRLMMCREGLATQIRSEALEDLREARNEVANEEDISGDVRADVLASLDARIAQLGR